MIAAAAVVFVALSAGAAAPLNIPFERYRLDNGLEVILSEDHRAPVVAVDLWVHVGSGDEQPGKSGFAHLFEHMMFQGAEHIGSDVHFDVLRKLGGTSVNGTTNSDRTNFYEVVPQNQLETALWLESDRLGFLLPMLNADSLKNQRDVVRNERRQRYDNIPYGRERFAVNAGLYPEGHPYRYLTIGKHEDIEGASVDDVRAFWTARYTPSNATLAVVGDIDVAATKALIQKWFGPLRKQAPPAKTTLAPPKLQKDARVDVADPFARLQRIRMVWHGPKNLDDDDLDLDLFTTALSAPGWGRLQRALVIDQPLCESVFAVEQAQDLSGTVQIGATLKPGTDVAVVEQILLKEIERAKADVADAEIVRGRRGTEAAFVFGLDELLGKAERLQWFNHETGDPGFTGTYLERLRGRTRASVQKAAHTWLDRPHLTVITKPAPPTTTTTTAPPPAAPTAPKGGAQ